MSPCPRSALPGTRDTSSRPAEQLLERFHNRGDPNITHFASRAQNDLHSAFGNLLSYRDSKRDTDQIGILEFDSRPLIAVVKNHVESSRFEPLRNVFRGILNGLIFYIDGRNQIGRAS